MDNQKPKVGWFAELIFRIKFCRGAFEVYYPQVSFVIFVVWYVFFEQFGPWNQDVIKNSLPAAISAVSVLAGFQGTALSILLAIDEKRIVQEIRELNKYSLLISYFKTALVSSFLFIFIAIALIYSHDLWGAAFKCVNWVEGGLIGLFLFVILASWRIIALMIRVLRES